MGIYQTDSRTQGDTTHTYRNISDQTTILHMILYNP